MKKKTIDDLLREYDITEKWLRECYIDKKMSIPEIKGIKNISLKTVWKLLNHFGIKTRSISESKSTNRYRCNLQKTLSKLGVKNVSQLGWVKKKKKETFKKHYGVDNIWKSKKYYEWLDEYMLENFGSKRTGCAIWDRKQHSDKTKNQWKQLSIEDRELKIKNQLKNLSKKATLKNTIELKLASILDNLKIKYIRFFSIGKKIYDFLLPEYNIIIECNGDFWHANPNIYTENQILKFPGTKGVIAKDLWKKDSTKISLANSHGFRVLTFWERDIKLSNFSEVFFNRLKEEINVD